MDIIIICNGLGNQMSQYALYLSKKHINKNTRFIFDKKSWKDHNGYELDKVFGITYTEGFSERFLYSIFRILGIKKFPLISGPVLKVLSFLGFKLINEDYDYNYHPQYLIPSNSLTFYYGGFHSEKYFMNVKTKVKDAFTFKSEEPMPELGGIIKKIKSTNSVAVHVRRGDFLQGENFAMFGAVCTEGYFEKAVQEMATLTPDPYFFVFTNDKAWARERFKGQNFEIVTYNEGANSWRDMYLISLCKHNINSNSSFSWWGAWLNSNPEKKVIIPHFFINNVKDEDVYPADWIKLSDY